LHFSGISIYLCCIQYLTIDHDLCSKISDQLHSVRLATSSEGRLLVSHSFCITVVRELQSAHNYHRRHADASHSSEFRVRVFQRVRHSSTPFVFPTQCSRCHFRAHEIPQVSNPTSSRTKRADTPSTALDRVEISIHTAIERHPTGSTVDDDSSTVASTSEQTPHPSKVSLAAVNIHTPSASANRLCLLVFLRHQRLLRCLRALTFHCIC
jgi:hypothetical protein